MPTIVLKALTPVSVPTVFDYTSAQSETFIIHTNGVRVSIARNFGGGNIHKPTVFGETVQEIDFTPLSPAGAEWEITATPHPLFASGEPRDGEGYIIIESLAT